MSTANDGLGHDLEGVRSAVDFTRMPYTLKELERACVHVMGYKSLLRLPATVFVAELDGIENGRTLLSPSMRVISQAVYDMTTYGAFMFTQES